MGVTRYTYRTLIREFSLILVAAIFCLPGYLLIELSLKTTTQTLTTPFTFPNHLQFSNYQVAWETGGQSGLARAFESSAIITVGTVVLLIAIGSVCAYAIARHKTRMGGLAYVMCLVALILPFQLGVIPMYVVMHHLGLVGNTLGMIILNTGLLMPLPVFLYTGFIRALPSDYEEAAQVDGAGILRTYARVVFPLMRPVTGTVAVLVGVLVWNEFYLALIFLAGSRDETLPVALYTFVGSNVTQWNLIFAAVAISIAPVLAFYLFAQRQLIRGFAGGIKG